MGLYKICIADGHFPEITIIPYFFFTNWEF